MKKLNLLLAGIVVMGLSVSCSDDDSSSNNNNSINEVRHTVKSGTWRITSFVEDTNDETTNFSDYDFKFDDNSVLTATDGTITYNGTWSVTDSDNSDDDNSSDIDFNINFASPQVFAELSDDWDILERTSTRIKLVDVSGGNGGTDYLTFEKN
jgi:hypothetical protein